jgi:cephalosporin hydroxylase
MSSILNFIVQKKPFCFVRINDGEASAIISETAYVSRGDEQSSKLMSEKLSKIIDDRYTHDNLYIGIPCVSCYHECSNIIKNRLSQSKTPKFMQNNIIDANILINANYDNTFDILTNHLHDRHIVVISNEMIISNIDRLKSININVNETHTVSSTMAFANDYETIKSLTFPNNSFIITLCGPLGRVLCYEWFLQNETLSCLDLGSFFDPLLRNKSYLYHTNNHRYCHNCYPTANFRYTKIFDYCNFYVDKECYYLNTISDHIRLYNNDWNRIVLNTIIRQEKNPNTFSSHLLTYADAQIFSQNNGYSFSNDIAIFDVLIRICKKYIPKRILVFGFDISTFLFLENCGCIVTVIDSDKTLIPEKYEDRITVISKYTTSHLYIYDLIYINEGNYFDILNYISKASYISDDKTLLVVNGYIKNKQHIDNYDITKACDICKDKGIIQPSLEEDYDVNVGLGVYTYMKFNIATDELVTNPYRLITGLYKTVDKNDKKKIDTFMEVSKMLNVVGYVYEGYTFQNFELFEDLMNFCHTHEPKNVLEIGFLCGTSALMFVMNTSGRVTSIDMTDSPYSEHYIKTIAGDRFTFMQGDSNNVTGQLIGRMKSICDSSSMYDLIFIDGSHEYNVIRQDVLNAIRLLHYDGYIIMNDVVIVDEFKVFWNNNTTQVYNDLLTMPEFNIKEVFTKSYCKGRGLVIFQVERNYSVNGMTKSLMTEEIQRVIARSCESNNSCEGNISRLHELIDAYLYYFSITLTHDEIHLLKFYNYKTIDELEDLLSCNMSDSIKEKINNKLIEHYEASKASKASIALVPKIIHLIYINERPLQSYNYKCIYSVIRHHPNYQIWIHNDIEPDADEWKALHGMSNVFIKKITRNSVFDGVNIQYVQYEADILRMNILSEHGGVYMDTDIYVVKNIDPLITTHGLYISKETNDSLINCVMISERGNKFLNVWFNYFKTGLRMDDWAWHIRDLPKMLLSNTYYLSKYNIKLLDHNAFCPIHWTEKSKIIDNTFELTDDIYGIHLFETILGNDLQYSPILSL